ncbi:MAG: SH3 domain-containing protein [Bacilli bacterium]|nr:SH3 domain-containing protein [Bacilli bacterium]
MAIKRNIVEEKVVEPVVVEEKPKTTTYVVNALLNFRAKPDGEILSTLKKGTEIEVEGKPGKWARATVDGQTGYVMTQFISVK